MRTTRIVLLVFASILILSCKEAKKSDSKLEVTPQQKAEDAIKSWMLTSNEHPHYKPIVFGDVTPRYERTDRSLQLSMQVDEEKAKNPDGSSKLDSLQNLLNQNQGNLLGYIVLHKYNTTNMAGETFSLENLFFLDTAFRVASVLNPESFDMILNEKPFFRPDSVE